MAAPQHMMQKKKSGNVRKVLIVILSVLGSLALIYGAGCLYFYNRFWPNTAIGTQDVSFLTAAEAKMKLAGAVDDSAVLVSGQGVKFTISSEQAGRYSNIDGAVDRALSKNKIWMWPVEIFANHDTGEALKSSFDTEKLTSAVTKEVESFNEGGIDPKDAYVYYDEASGTYMIDPGTVGTKLDVTKVIEAVIRAFGKDIPIAKLTSDDLVQQSVAADSPQLLRKQEQANTYIGCNTSFTIAGETFAVLDSQVIKDWVSFTAAGNVILDMNQVDEWSKEIANRINSVGTTRNYTRPDGKNITVSGGTYGWGVDSVEFAAVVSDAIVNARVGSVEIPTYQNAVVINPGGQDWGARYIDVDLSEQYVRFYDSSGYVIWESPCVSGAIGGHETPTGVYMVNMKDRAVTLRGQIVPSTGLPEYESYVEYWMPFIGNMVGLHDATWQPAFGYGRNQIGYGSHGCVNLPFDAAQSLYSMVYVGDVVITHY
ncbi:MAG: L,D-transpeptidase family protein [Coriobacteriales bacterium]|nr:L,D-transpeptidase family protein [Coriobacteriales bacterium]